MSKLGLILMSVVLAGYSVSGYSADKKQVKEKKAEKKNVEVKKAEVNEKKTAGDGGGGIRDENCEEQFGRSTAKVLTPEPASTAEAAVTTPNAGALEGGKHGDTTDGAAGGSKMMHAGPEL